MGRPVKRTTQFCIGLRDELGALAGLCTTLFEANVNVEALFVSSDENGVWVNMVASPADQAEQTLQTAGYNFFAETVLTIQGDNRPGVLMRIACRLAAEKVNINYVYGGGAEASVFTLVLSVDDVDRAVEALQAELDGV